MVTVMSSIVAVLSVTVKIIPLQSVVSVVHSCTDNPEMVLHHIPNPEGVKNDESLDEIV